jgi:Protein of unknown function (DUF1203)
MYKTLIINTLCSFYVSYVPMCFKKNLIYLFVFLKKKLSNMKNNFQFIALDATLFTSLFEKKDADLATLGAHRMIVKEKPGTPCRISLADAEIGEEVILMPYTHHATHSPYQSSGPIFVRKNVATATVGENEIPLMFHHRLLSLRGYDQNAMMIEANVLEGKDLAESISQIFDNASVAYIHVHNARPGCYNCLVKRA